ncbi:MAG: DUF4340 domain-containing protein [Cyclobacteriaceae bacterium]
MLKGNKTLLLFVVLGVLVGAYAIVKLTSGSSRSKSYREVLVEIDTAKVTKVEILSQGTKTTLEKSDDSWTVNGDKKALAANVKSMLNTLKGAKPSRLASRSKDSWKDFQVDSTGTRVIVYEGSSEVLDLIIGRFGVEGQRSFYNYVRLEEDVDVYVANDFMGMSVGKTDKDYRNNGILRLKKDSISSVDFSYPEGTYTLSKLAEGKWSMAGVEADSANVAQFLNGLAFVSSKNFEDGAVGDSDKEVIIHLNGEDDISIKSFGESILSSSTNDAEYFNDKSNYDKVFKTPEYFTAQ